MNRIYDSKELNDLLGIKFLVLDKGFIEVIDYMGNDKKIVDSARTSYEEKSKRINDDNALIRYMISHYHTSPFEQNVITFRIKVPMDTWRQWIRHRTASVNEYSTRYSIAIDDKQETLFNQWRLQSKSNKQGSSGFLTYDDGYLLTKREKELHDFSKEIYKERLNKGIAREQARKDLPLSTYTIAIWTMDVHNLLHFLKLRMDNHAQYEIRQYANEIAKIVKIWLPNTWDAFENYILNSIVLSQEEIYRISNKDSIKFESNREEMEFNEKLKKLKILLSEADI